MKLDMVSDDAMTVEELSRRLVGLRLRKAIQLVAAVTTKSRKDVKRIHRLRTETRRADAALRLFADWLPHRRTGWIRRRLDDVRSKSGTVRDLDVLLPSLKELSRLLPRQTRKYLLDRAGLQRAEAMHSLRHYCRKLLKCGFEERTRLLTHQTDWRQTTAEPGVRELSALAIDRLATAYFAAVDLLRADGQQLHRVRILGRRLRYSLDLLRNVLPKFPIKEVCQELAAVQDALGLVNDQATALRFLQISAQKCCRQHIPERLRRAVDSLEMAVVEQVASVTRQVIDKVPRVQHILAEFQDEG